MLPPCFDLEYPATHEKAKCEIVEYFDGEQLRRGKNLVKSIIFIVLITEVLKIVYFTQTNIFLLHKAGMINGWLMLILTIIGAVAGGILLLGSDYISAYMKYQKRTRPR